MKLNDDRFILSYTAVAVFTLGALVGIYAGRTDAATSEPVDVLQQKYNINCPLKFYLENDKLVVKSFSCTLSRKNIIDRSAPK